MEKKKKKARLVFIFLLPRVQAMRKLPPPFRAASLLVPVRTPGRLSLRYRQTNPVRQTSRIAKGGKWSLIPSQGQ